MILNSFHERCRLPQPLLASNCVAIAAILVCATLPAVSQAAPAARSGSAARPSAAARSTLLRATPLQSLTFNVAARLTSGSNEPQTLSSRVWAKGNKVRIETEMGGKPIVFLAAPPYLYKLIPSAKAGVRWKSARLGSGRFDLASLINPSAIRTQLKARGARAVGTQTVGGSLTDIFQANNVGGRGTDIRAWLRRSDSLPLRVETRSKSLSSVVTWSNYRRNTTLSDTLFRVPAGYKVRESQGKPGLF